MTPRRLLLAVFLLLVFAIPYGVANRLTPYPPILLSQTFVDMAIPFTPWTMWIYLSCYLFAPMIFFYLRSPLVLKRFMQSFVASVLVACLIFWFYPTTLPRTELSLVGQHPFMVWVFQTFWSLDAPQNCWPSLHVGLSYLAAFAAIDEAIEPAYRRRQPIAWFALFWATAITLSTMSVRQHYFWDALGGLTLAALTYGGAWWWAKRSVH